MTNSAINKYIQTELASGRGFEDIIKEITDTINEASAQHEKEKTLYPYRQPIYQMENDVDLILDWFDTEVDGRPYAIEDIDPLLDAISRIYLKVLLQKDPALFKELPDKEIEEVRKGLLDSVKTLTELHKPATKKIIDQICAAPTMSAIADGYGDIFKTFFDEIGCGGKPRNKK